MLVTLARKPFQTDSLSENVLLVQTGALNIEATRLPTEEDLRRVSKAGVKGYVGTKAFRIRARTAFESAKASGRYPSNVIVFGVFKPFPFWKQI